YNNAFYQEQVPFPEIDSNAAQTFLQWHLSSSLVHTVVKNNVGYGYVNWAAVESGDNSRFSNTLSLDYNMWNNLTDSTKTYLWSGTSYTLAGFRAALGYEAHALQANPLFVDSTNRNFTLQSTSSAIDAGTFLTTTVGSGSGTTLTVADAGFFTDGFGLVAGDMIQVGSNSPVQITSINYGTNAITVARSISWSNGQGVSLPYSGARPDMGAHENAMGTPNLPAPTNLRITQQ